MTHPRAIREALGWTIAQMAAHMHRSRWSVMRWEKSGKLDPLVREKYEALAADR